MCNLHNYNFLKSLRERSLCTLMAVGQRWRPPDSKNDLSRRFSVSQEARWGVGCAHAHLSVPDKHQRPLEPQQRMTLAPTARLAKPCEEQDFIGHEHFSSSSAALQVWDDGVYMLFWISNTWGTLGSSSVWRKGCTRDGLCHLTGMNCVDCGADEG